MSSLPVVCLASASPRRRELLAQIGVPHTVRPADIDESVRNGESIANYVERMAREKALHVRAHGSQLPVLAADTTVIVDGTVFGKPRDRDDGLRMLAALSGRAHQVLTVVALASAEGVSSRASESTVHFRETTWQERAAFWDSGEPCDKAGAYAIQGRGAVFIAALSGSYSGVVGLPLYETAELLRAARIAYWQSP
jgi:septum formation protein